jgi:hypothetical protein
LLTKGGVLLAAPYIYMYQFLIKISEGIFFSDDDQIDENKE